MRSKIGIALVSVSLACLPAQPARDPYLGTYLCHQPTQLALDLARARVNTDFQRAVGEARAERPGAIERVHGLLHTVVPVLRRLPLKRTVAVNIEPALDSQVDTVGAPLFALALDRSVRRSGYYDFLDKRVHATEGEQLTWTLVHEMAHALVDQHVNFARLYQEAQGDTDRLLALGAVFEGDANLTAFAYARSLCDPESVLRASRDELDDLFELWWRFRPTAENLGELAEGVRTPAAKSHAGTRFAVAVTRQGGWSQLESVYEHPPLSTEQILHPAKYLDGRDRPWQVELPLLTTLSDWDLLAEDAMGELRLRLLFEDYDDRSGAASGWGGDTFRLYGSAQGTTGVVWVSRWDTDEDAAEFTDSFVHLRQRRPEWVGLPMARQERPVISRRGSDVTILDGFPPWKAQGLLVELQQTRFRIKRPNPLAATPVEVVRRGEGKRRRVRFDLMAIGARDCRVAVDGESIGYAPVVRAKVPRGWCTVEVRCGDGHVYSAPHRLTRGRNVIVIRHEDWR